MMKGPFALTLSVTLALGVASCGKNESGSATADAANNAAVSAADTEAAKAAEASKAEAARVAEAAKTAEAAKAEAARVADAAKAEAAKTADNAKTQGVIDNAKSLIAAGNYTDATSLLQQLAGKILSDDQSKLVESLKEQIQKAIVDKAAENAVGSAGNLLKK